MKKRARSRRTQYGKGKIVQMPSGYQADMRRLVDDMFEVAVEEGWTTREFAARAHLCPVTIWALRERITRFPRFDTIWKLAKATGFNVRIEAKRAGASKLVKMRRVALGD